MDYVISKILRYMELEEEWSELEKMKMQLGLQVLCHNFFMVSCILLLAKLLGIFTDAGVLLMAYGLLKLTAGGIHFSKSLFCLFGTGIFIVGGVIVARHMNLSFFQITLIYGICMLILWLIGPQGTENNPILPRYYHTLKCKTIIIASSYYIISLYSYMKKNGIVVNLLLVAIVFETVTILPNKVRSRFK